ncbi:unnamed protein product [Caenorhabditis brenneri]
MPSCGHHQAEGVINETGFGQVETGSPLSFGRGEPDSPPGFGQMLGLVAKKLDGLIELQWTVRATVAPSYNMKHASSELFFMEQFFWNTLFCLSAILTLEMDSIEKPMRAQSCLTAEVYKEEMQLPAEKIIGGHQKSQLRYFASEALRGNISAAVKSDKNSS